MGVDQLIFVYNANSGLGNSLLDSAHKMMSPSTYQCQLCQLTHGAFKEKAEWRGFRESALVKSQVKEISFLHADEFQQKYRSKWLPKFDYPCILQATNNGLELFISDKELKQLSTTNELINTIKIRLKT